MSYDLCPFCYHQIDRRRLWYVCKGNPAPGHRRCAQQVNNDRLVMTGHEEEMYPVFPPRMPWLLGPLRRLLPRRMHCPNCRGRTGGQVCPHCKSPLPPEFPTSFSPVIAMAGARSTGKTVYLTVLAKQILDLIAPRFDADVQVIGDAGNAWLARNIDLLFRSGRLPALTQQPDGRSEPLLFEWRRRRSRLRHRFRSSYLSFLDTAGEMLGTERGVADLRFLAKVHAFIILLDPFAIPGLPDRIGLPEEAQSSTTALTVVQQVTRVLREERGQGGMIDLPVAVVFAKIDALRDLIDREIFEPESEDGVYDAAAGRRMHIAVQEMLHKFGAQNIDKAFESSYTNFQYFAVSSLGHQPDYQANKVEPNMISPIRVSEPLIWLLAQYKIVPRTGNG